MVQTYGKSLGETAFEAYNERAGGKTHDGKKIPEWAKLGDDVRANWQAAADAVAQMVTNNRTKRFPRA